MSRHQNKKEQHTSEKPMPLTIIDKMKVWERNFYSLFTSPMILDDQRRAIYITLWIMFGTLAISFPIAYMFNNIFIAFTSIAVAYAICILALCPNWLKREYANPHWVEQNTSRDYYQRLKDARNEWKELKEKRKKLLNRMNKKKGIFSKLLSI